MIDEYTRLTELSYRLNQAIKMLWIIRIYFRSAEN